MPLQRKPPLNPLSAECDLLEPIRKRVQHTKTTCLHVEGHQDRSKEEDELDDRAKLNISADAAARKALRLPVLEALTPGHRATLIIQRVPITTHYKKEIRRAYHSGHMLHHFCTKNNISEQSLDNIDFEAFQASLKSLSIDRKFTFLKFVHGWLPTNSQQNTINGTTMRCDCGEQESCEHLLNCTRYEKIRNDFIRNFDLELRKYHTNRGLHRLIMHLIRYGDDSKYKMRVSEDFHRQLRSAYRQQCDIGINMMWRGIISQKFGDIQEATYRRWEMDDKFNGTVWSRMIVTQFVLYFENLLQERNKMINKKKVTGRVAYLREKIWKILDESIRIPEVLQQTYEKGKNYLNQANPKVQNMQRWINLMTEVETFRKHQEQYDRSLGRDIRSFCEFENKSRSYHNIRKRKRDIFENDQSEERKNDSIGQVIFRVEKRPKYEHGHLTDN